MRSSPFPVLAERSENNSDPEFDQLRRNIFTQILTDFGNADAVNRCIVSTPYNKHLNGMEAEPDGIAGSASAADKTTTTMVVAAVAEAFNPVRC